MMFLSPRKIKTQKQHSRRDSTKTLTSTQTTQFGNIGIYAQESGKISSKQIQALKLSLRRASQRQVKVWSNMHIFRSVTKKPNETRLGRGKGNVKYWNYVVRPGSLLLEIKTNNPILTKRLLQKLKYMLSVKTIIKYKYYRWIL